MEDIEKYL